MSPKTAEGGGAAPVPPERRAWRPGVHFLSGVWVSCCEVGETDCPCTCHDVPNLKGVPS